MPSQPGGCPGDRTGGSAARPAAPPSRSPSASRPAPGAGRDRAAIRPERRLVGRGTRFAQGSRPAKAARRPARPSPRGRFGRPGPARRSSGSAFSRRPPPHHSMGVGDDLSGWATRIATRVRPPIARCRPWLREAMTARPGFVRASFTKAPFAPSSPVPRAGLTTTASGARGNTTSKPSSPSHAGAATCSGPCSHTTGPTIPPIAPLDSRITRPPRRAPCAKAACLARWSGAPSCAGRPRSSGTRRPSRCPRRRAVPPTSPG